MHSSLRILSGVIKIAAFLAAAMLGVAHAVPNTDHPTPFLGPTAAFSYTGTISPEFAVSVLAEAGNKNFRAGGTFGWAISNDERLKISGEWLWQDITYAFFSGNANRWVQQGAVGGDFQVDIDGWRYAPQFDISGYYSHAPSVGLGSMFGSYTNSAGQIVNYTNVRRIAGSNAGGGAAGFTVAPWRQAQVGADLNYDAVRYNITNSSYNGDAYGFGGTAFYRQGLGDHFNFGVEAEVRHIFNNYQAYVNYDDLYYMGRWGLGVFGDYTHGKVRLPNSWNAGININYFADCVMPSVVDYKHEATPAISNAAFLNWVRDPAVYMPQVLAIVDEAVTRACTGPIVTGAIRELIVLQGTTITPIEAASVFSGPGLTYSATGLPANLTINSVTGAISGTANATGTFPVTVTASNTCSAATTSFLIVVNGIG